MQVVISELQSSNKNTLVDEDGDSSDWVELHNLGTQTISLAVSQVDPGTFVLLRGPVP